MAMRIEIQNPIGSMVYFVHKLDISGGPSEGQHLDIAEKFETLDAGEELYRNVTIAM